MRARGTRTSLVAAVAAFAMVVGGILTATPAAAVVGGTVSGTVTSASLPLANIRVTFYPLTGSGDQAASVVTDGAGAYSVSGLEQGDYRVYFTPNNPTSSYAAVWWGNTAFEASGNVLTLGAAAIANVNAALAVGGTITGTITTSSATDKGAAAAFLKNPATGQWERFSRWVNADANGNYSIYGLQTGEHLLRFARQGQDQLVSTEYWNNAPFWAQAQLLTISGTSTLSGRNATLAQIGVNPFRLDGPNRNATSVAIANKFDPAPTTVFIVNGKDFPDALSAGPAAALLGAPVLLVAPDVISTQVRDKLTALKPEKIYVVGGIPSVGTAVYAQLQTFLKAGGTIERIEGTNRYDTSRKVATRFFSDESVRTAYITTGLGFPDALSAGPAAANEKAPVILVNGAEPTADAATTALLQDLGVSRLVIAGSDITVSAGIEASLRDSGSFAEVYRRAGVNRYDTAAKVAAASFPLADTVFLATGLGFPDALAGTGLAGKSDWRAPIYLVRTDCVPQQVFDEIARLKPREIYILGGTPSIANGVLGLPAC